MSIFGKTHKKTVHGSAASSENDVRRNNFPTLPPKNENNSLPGNIDWNEVNEVIDKSIDELAKACYIRDVRIAVNNTVIGKYDIQMTETTRQVIRCLHNDIEYICSHAPEYEKNTAHIDYLKNKYTGLDEKIIVRFRGQFIMENFVF